VRAKLFLTSLGPRGEPSITSCRCFARQHQPLETSTQREPRVGLMVAVAHPSF
jgi:hypothetical protein